MAMIYNGYNTWFKPINDVESITSKYIDNTGYFFFLGNTDPKKNTERTLIAYSNYCKQSSVKRKLLVADLAPQYLEEFIVKNKLDNIRDQVVLTGYVVNSHLPYIYNGAFAFLYTSLRESFGIPLLEAMACGVPGIGTNIGGIPEVIDHGTNGYIVELGDVDAVAHYAIELLSNEAKLAEFRINALESVQTKFKSEKIIEQYEKLYEKLAAVRI